jgi:hypothetical protein
VDDSSNLYSKPFCLWSLNESGLTDAPSVVPGLTVWSLLARLWPGESAPYLFPPSAGQGLPQTQSGKWHRPSAVTQKRHQQRPKGEATKQRASEQTIFPNLSSKRAWMKMWCFLNRDSANKWRESCALWRSFPVAYVTRIFLGKLLVTLLVPILKQIRYNLTTKIQRIPFKTF